jgi:DNA repair protein SbcD/Mre11
MVTMPSVRIVATADNHLNRFYDRMSPQKLARRRQYLRDGFKAAVDHACTWPAHLFVIAGDLFDQPDPRNVDRAFVAHCLARLRTAGVQVVAIGGNHDTPRQSTDQGGYTPLEIYDKLDGLHYFDKSGELETEIFDLGGLRVAVAGMSPDQLLPPGSDPLEGISWMRPGDADLVVVVLHGLVEGYGPPEPRAPVFRMASLRALQGADAVIVGDIHRPAQQQLGDQLMVIPGATERMTFGEHPDVPGFMILEGSRSRITHAERIQLSGQPRAELLVRPTELDPHDQLGGLVERLTAIATPETMVRLRLEGVIGREQYHSLQLRQLAETIAPQCFHFTIDTGGLLIEDERHQLAERGVRFSQQEELRTYANELLATAGTPNERQVIEAALERLLDRY